MDLIEPILSIAKTLYALCEEVKANSKRCKRLKGRMKGLEQVLKATEKKGASQLSDEVQTALKELKITLESATEVVKNYNADKEYLIKRIVKTYSHGEEFESLNQRLNDAFQILSLNLQVDIDQNVHKLFEASTQQKQDEADRKEDTADIQKMLQQIAAQGETAEKKMEKLDLNMDEMKADVKQIMEIIQKPERVPKDIRKIISEDLIFDFPKTPFMRTDISEVYRGEYKKYPVAIKRYLCPKNTIPGEVMQIFEKEIETMIRYESPYILRMFGVCFQGTNGLVVMEYCEKGSLREALDNPKFKLRWERKARMCLDAAQGIYRLHQSEQKSKVHGSITSDKFMVAEGYRLKLGGLELAQTETSLRRNSRTPKKSSLRYRSPEQLESVHHPYCKTCEIYSLGMVLWEIATREKPFNDCTTDQHIFKRVCVENRVLEDLPPDCPKELAELINACRASDPFQRPTAGVLVDKLRKVVERFKDEDD